MTDPYRTYDEDFGDEELNQPLPSVDIPVLRRDRRKALRFRQWVASLMGLTAFVVIVMVFLMVQFRENTSASHEILKQTPSLDVTQKGSIKKGTGLDSNSENGSSQKSASPSETTLGASSGSGQKVLAKAPVDSIADLHTLPTDTQVYTFGQSSSFRQRMLEAGLSPQECSSLESQLRSHLDFRKCRPTHKFSIERTTLGHLISFKYHFDHRNFVQVQRKLGSKTQKKSDKPVSEQGQAQPENQVQAVSSEHQGTEWETERISLELTKERVVQKGRVFSALGLAMEQAEMDVSMTNRFVEAFAGKIDFGRDVRPGDTFRILLEAESIGGKLKGYGQAYLLEYQGIKSGLHRAFWYEKTKNKGAWFDDSGRELSGGWLRSPVANPRITSRFNPRRRHPILKKIMPHYGVDFGSSTGTVTRAAADGVILFAGYKGPNGNLVTIRHGDGYQTAYAHLHKIQRGIRKGVKVKAGQMIGTVGSTGRSTGPHLHFGLKRNGRWMDPLPELESAGRALPKKSLRRFKAHVKKLIQELENKSTLPALPRSATES